MIKRVTASNYNDFIAEDIERGFMTTYCPQSDMFCPKPEPEYKVPSSLTKRGLQVGHPVRSSSDTWFIDCLIACNLGVEMTNQWHVTGPTSLYFVVAD